MKSLIRTTVLAIGQHRGNPRIYIEGRYLQKAGFAPGSHYDITYQEQRIHIQLSKTGRIVSGKRQDAVSVIDLHNQLLGQTFADASRVTVQCRLGQITITLDRTSIRCQQRELNDRSVALFAGGGLLSEAARQAGFTPVAAIEIDRRYADIYQDNHDGHMINTSVEEAPWEDLSQLAPIGLLEMGIPCEPYSAIRRLNRGGQTKRDSALPPEAHELGDMVYWALKATDVLNPHTVVVEQVPQFLASGAGFILRLTLQRMGYTVDAQVINPLDHGAITGRRRAVIVATTFDQIDWPIASGGYDPDRTLGEWLDDVPHDSDLWFDRTTKPWLYRHWDRQTAQGNGFEPPKLTARSTSCPTIKKRYFAGQGDNPVIQHPRKIGVYRWLTLTEVRRLMGLPDTYNLGATKTTAGEVLGQGIEVGTFTQIIRSVTRKGVNHAA